MKIRAYCKKLWTKQRISKLRIISKKKLAEMRANRALGRFEKLDEAEALLAGMGLKPSNSQEEAEKEIDARFIDNP